MDEHFQMASVSKLKALVIPHCCRCCALMKLLPAWTRKRTLWFRQPSVKSLPPARSSPSLTASTPFSTLTVSSSWRRAEWLSWRPLLTSCRTHSRSSISWCMAAGEVLVLVRELRNVCKVLETGGSFIGNPSTDAEPNMKLFSKTQMAEYDFEAFLWARLLVLHSAS